MANQQRIGRIQAEVLRHVSEILASEVKDPRIQAITVTEVDLTGDLQEATVYYSSLDDDPKKIEDIQKALDKASGMIQSKVGQQLTTYHTPRLTFKRDQSIEQGNRIDQLLNQIKDNN